MQREHDCENKTMNIMLSDKDLKTIQDILIEVLEITREQITLEARLEEDLGADSLHLTEIGMALEDRFSLSIPDEQLERIKTVADAYEVLSDLLGQTGRV